MHLDQREVVESLGEEIKTLFVHLGNDFALESINVVHVQAFVIPSNKMQKMILVKSLPSVKL